MYWLLIVVGFLLDFVSGSHLWVDYSYEEIEEVAQAVKDPRAENGLIYLGEGAGMSTFGLIGLNSIPSDSHLQYPKASKETLQFTFRESKPANICYHSNFRDILYFDGSQSGSYSCINTINPLNCSAPSYELIYYLNNQVPSGGLDLNLISMRPDSSTTTNFFSYRPASSIIE
ncbi:hypothetical protein KL909_000401 [Ogataea angusta]|uniref:Uncharacterized protein n=1 Tax=Pichia angusta TaxID=870730 RepID=A0ABQ7S408_PICAN|nr:hypothetical protein KL909_000401 [Ogataea angusta]KAG7852705.1 hypothetical protein KL940_000406 [Ogataea angusta]KAG7859580.1 hypothetical protein KL939_002480 [Ogataea angusta]